MIRRMIVGIVVSLTWAYGQAEFPAEVSAGERFELSWKGEATGRLAILSKAEDGTYSRVGSFIYLNNKKTSFPATAPVEPGDYFIGKDDGGEWADLKALKVIDVEAGLNAPEEVEINQSLEVEWSGPAAGTTIGIYRPATEEQKAKRFHFSYPANAKGGPVKLTSPMEPGNYEIRYMMSSRILASRPLRVGGTAATLSGAPTVPAGSEIEISWSGPRAAQNTIGFAKAGADKRSGHYRYTGNIEGDTVMLTAPEELGDYEVVFMVRSQIIARHPVKVVPVTANLEAPDEVTEYENFEITWSGPGNRGDSVAAFDGEGSRSAVVFPVPEDNAKSGVVEMKAPAAGAYTLRYLTNKKKVLAERPIKVVPAPQKPGRLLVTTKGARAFGENSAVEVILDASGSMLQRQDGKRRIEIAKETLLGLLGETIPAGTPFALRVFGHKEADSCRTDLEIPLGPLDVAAARSKVSAINAMNLAKTPIAASLAKTREDLAGVSGERVIILLTDGEETCDGDPLTAINLLKQAGADVRVNVVGYAIGDVALQETFMMWAAVGSGQYLNAPNASELAAGLKQALQLPFEIWRDNALVEESITGRNPLTLPAGDYEVRFRWNGAEVTKGVSVVSERQAELHLP